MSPHARRHRKNVVESGHAHELTFSCYKGFKFLAADRTRQWLAESIENARELFDFDLWAYVFMPEHVHLIIHPRKTDYSIAEVRKSIKAPVGTKAIKHLLAESPDWIPRITRRRGKKIERLFWQSGGGFDRNVVEPATLETMIDYIHLNPVRRGLIDRPEEWKWSSAAWFLEAGEPPVVPDRISADWMNYSS